MPGADWEYEQMDISRQIYELDKQRDPQSGSAIQAMEMARRDELMHRMHHQEERIRVLEDALVTQAGLQPPPPINIEFNEDLHGNNIRQVITNWRDTINAQNEEEEKPMSEEDSYLDRLGVDNE